MTDISIHIEDTGIGISEEDQIRIFEAFTQAKNNSASQFGGTGLGLNIVQKLAALMNGEVYLTSKLGEGSKFSLFLKNVEIATDKEKVIDPDYFQLDNIEFEPAVILIADDISVNRKLIKQYLEPYPNLKCITADNGQEAFYLALEHRPDLILMDIRMPVMNGFEAIEKIKKHPSLSAIPILAITAAAFEENKLEISAICDGYLQKPISQKQLIKRISAFLKTKFTENQAEPNLIVNEELTKEELIKYSALYEILENEKLPKSKELLEVLAITELKKFAEEIRQLGEVNQYNPLIRWSQDLAKNISLFDTKAMNTALERFPLLLKILREI